MAFIDTDRVKCNICGRMAPYNCVVCAQDLCSSHRTNHSHKG